MNVMTHMRSRTQPPAFRGLDRHLIAEFPE